MNKYYVFNRKDLNNLDIFQKNFVIKIGRTYIGRQLSVNKKFNNFVGEFKFQKEILNCPLLHVSFWLT